MNKQTAPLETVLEVAAEVITSREMTVALLVELAEARLQERFLDETIAELQGRIERLIAQR